MDIAATKLELMQRLMLIGDETILQRVVSFFKKEVPDALEEDDITAEEYAEFEEEIAKHKRGEIKFHSAEESIRMIREGYKG